MVIDCLRDFVGAGDFVGQYYWLSTYLAVDAVKEEKVLHPNRDEWNSLV